jgi:hypothetical protein
MATLAVAAAPRAYITTFAFVRGIVGCSPELFILRKSAIENTERSEQEKAKQARSSSNSFLSLCAL